jgi:N-acetylmuramoyl-L-alanine amidase
MEASTVFNCKTGTGSAASAFALYRPERPVRLHDFMRLAVVLFAGLMSLLTALAQNPLSKLEHFPLSGSDYVRLADWAKAFNFQIHSARQSEEMQLTNAGARLVFTLESQRAEINGVTVLLSSPVLARNGIVYIAVVDLQTVLQPVLFPPKNTGSVSVLCVCLDPGHGGKDPGNQEGRRQEKAYTLLLAREVRSLLTRAGLKVILTRNGDNFLPLPDRPEYARRRGADLFVSLHFNASLVDKNHVKGFEVYCLTPPGASSTNARGDTADATAFAGNQFDGKNMLLAYQIQKAMVKSLPVEDRGVKHARFAVLRDARVPAALVEAGFMSHPQESERIFNPDFRRQLARAIAEGILAYKRWVER